MAAQTYQLVITGNLAGQFVQNVFHYRMDDDSFATRLAAAKGLIDGFEAADNPSNWLSLVPVPYIWQSVKARCMTDGGGPEYISLNNQGDAGLQGSTVQDSSSGPVILWHNTGPNRSTGKTFVPGIGVGNAEGGEISASFIGILFSFATDFRAAFNAVGGTTPSCELVTVKTGDPTTRYLIDGLAIAKDIGKQRRRQLPV